MEPQISRVFKHNEITEKILILLAGMTINEAMAFLEDLKARIKDLCFIGPFRELPKKPKSSDR